MVKFALVAAQPRQGCIRMIPKKQILLVDDDCDVREVLKLSLERHGYKTFEASNGAHAIELCKLKTFDLVIADIYMPGMDGLKFIEILREFSPKTVIIAISGGESCHFFKSSLQLNTALHKGAVLSLKKPVKEAELLGVVKKYAG